MSEFLKYRSLTINGKKLEETELRVYCENQINVDSGLSAVYNFILEWLDDNPMVELKTSGSTGLPKTISVEKDKMLFSASLTAEYFQFKAGQNALLCLSADYIAGKMMIVRAMFSGLNLICVAPQKNPLGNLPQDLTIDFAAMIPMQIADILNSTPESLSTFRKILLGGGPVDPKLDFQLQNLNTAVYHGYGMTETLSHVALRRINGSNQSKSYTALKGIQLNLETRGCLTIFSSGLLDAPVITNDLVEFTDFNEFIWLGRFDNVLNSGGVKILPEVLEQKLEKLLHSRFYFTGIPDDQLGQKLVLIIEGEEFDKTTKALFNKHLMEQFDKYQIPKEIYFIEKFVETATGKVNRNLTTEEITSRL